MRQPYPMTQIVLMAGLFLAAIAASMGAFGIEAGDGMLFHPIFPGL